MSHHESALKAQFYLTAPQPCAYLDGREERKVFTTLQGTNAISVNNALSLLASQLRTVRSALRFRIRFC
ncbi:MAG: hypothetical protein AAFP67_10645, partial [Pseudomonadota bacterium]